jgi:hypothetical protein
MLLLPLAGYGQSMADMSELLHPTPDRDIPDGATLWYRIGQDARLRDGLWETSINSDRAPRLSNHIVPKAEARPSVPGSPNASAVTSVTRRKTCGVARH